MKIIQTIAIFGLFFISTANAQEHTEQLNTTKKVIGYLENEQADEIYSLFDDTMKSSITAEKLADIWKSLPAQFGEYLGDGAASARDVQGMIVVDHVLDFETSDLYLRLAFNSDHQISGLFFLPVEKKKEQTNPD